MKTQLNNLLLTALVMVGAVAADNPSRRAVDEASVIVAYLYNFGKFIEWPSSAFASEQASLRFCVYGENPFGEVADALEGKLAHGRPIQVERLKRGEALTGCHLVFVSDSERFYVKPLLNLTQGLPLLTVSEIPDFASLGGSIGLVPQGSRLKFEVNTESTDAAGLRVSSQLLKLAVKVWEKKVIR